MGRPNAKTDLKSNDADKYLRMYEQMWKIRAFEEQANNLYLSRKMPGLTHLYLGQEAVAVGVCDALTDDDFITSTHRGHGHCVAKGGEPDRMFAELLGKADGYCKGKGGSMHIADTQRGNLGANAIVGGSLGIATGAAFSCKMRGVKDVAACFFGDGALGQGLFYEVANMAKLWSLPIVYVCEHNLYGEYTHYTEQIAGQIADRPKAFGIGVTEVDGQDVVAVNNAAAAAIDQARNGGGPSFLLCNTYRYHGHHVGDVDRTFYRSKEEETYWKTERDPIRNFGDWLQSEELATSEDLSALEKGVYETVDAAVAYAENAPFPDIKEVDTHVFA